MAGPLAFLKRQMGGQMKMYSCGFAFAAMMTGVDAKSLSAQEWQTLDDEPSRADLFAEYIVPKKIDDKQAHATALLGPFVFPSDTTYDKIKDRPRADVIFGIDISHYEGSTFRFDGLKAQNVRFVYARATQGIAYKDGRFAEYWAALAASPPETTGLRAAYLFRSS